MSSIAVIIPCFRQAHYLKEAIESVDRQRVAVALVVAAGTDEDSRAARELGVQHVIDRADRGVADARNQAIEATPAEILLPLDADDVLEPTFLLTCLSQRPPPTVERWIVSTDVQEFGGRANLWRLPPYDQLHQCNTLSVTSLFSRALWEKAQGYDPAAIGAEDWDYWVRCAYHDPRVTQVHQALLLHRVHAESMSAKEAGLEGYWKAMLHLRHPARYGTHQLEADRKLVDTLPISVREEMVRRRAWWPDNAGLFL